MKHNIVRGILYLVVAQVAFVASGYAVHSGPGRLLGHDGYGIFAVVISLMTIVNLVLVAGMPQAVSDKVCWLRHNPVWSVKPADGALT
jgi:O-antigen/teichoic acid export membrane protein